MHNFKELKFWQKARRLTKSTYLVTDKFPKEERFGLTNQIRRSIVSVSSNIAEGCGRGTDKELIRFLDIAQGSACELESQLILAYDLEFIDEQELNYLSREIDEIQKMMFSFRRKLVKGLK